MNKYPNISAMHALVVAVLAAALTACASIGRPEGGPRDETPPEFVRSTPGVGATKVDRQTIDLYFNENVQLQDAFSKVVVSPAQKNTPRVSANGRHVRVELQDSLLPNTTYTIDFADAIKDLNEGNILDGFATCFSTGDSIDTLSISGMVLEARTLEPAQGMLVGVYSNLSDTAIRTLPLERIARTNQLGQFSVLNLKPGEYRVYAINDVNRDYHWDRSEDVAWYDVTVRPYAETITVTDTLRSAANEDSLVTRQGTAFKPNDLLLTWFNEGYQAQYLKDYNRNDRNRLHLYMAAKSDSLPEITIAKGKFEGRPIEDWTVANHSAHLDSLEYWISDPEVLAIDSLMLSVKYLRTDTTDMLTWKTDTLRFFYKEPKPKKEKKKKDEEADTLPPPVRYLNLRAVTATTHEVYMPVIFGIDQPIDSLDASMVHLEVQQDTLWLPVDARVEVDSLNPLLNRRVYAQWKPGEKYRLTVDSAAMTGLYGEWNNRFKHEFKVKELEEYANLVFNVTGNPGPAIVEIVDKSDKVLRVAPVVGGKATFRYLAPGTVYARLFDDRNDNGEWDTGYLADSIQPEDVYYYPKKINLKKNWDVNLDWNINEIAVDQQKPYDIKKNKPKLKKGERAPRDEEDEDEDDVFGDYNSAYTNGRRNSRNNTNSSRSPGRNNMSNPMGAMRGMMR